MVRKVKVQLASVDGGSHMALLPTRHGRSLTARPRGRTPLGGGNGITGSGSDHPQDQTGDEGCDKDGTDAHAAGLQGRGGGRTVSVLPAAAARRRTASPGRGRVLRMLTRCPGYVWETGLRPSCPGLVKLWPEWRM
ncbi:hypothetical protein GCM10009612_74960 [Streptomyces beijiangensis]